MQRFIERFGALFGAVSIIGIIVMMAIEGDPPDVSEKTTEQIVAHWVDMGNGAWFAMWVGIIVGILMLLWGLWPSNALRERGVTLLTPAVAVGTVLIAVGIDVHKCWRPGNLIVIDDCGLEVIISPQVDGHGGGWFTGLSVSVQAGQNVQTPVAIEVIHSQVGGLARDAPIVWALGQTECSALLLPAWL